MSGVPAGDAASVYFGRRPPPSEWVQTGRAGSRLLGPKLVRMQWPMLGATGGEVAWAWVCLLVIVAALGLGLAVGGWWLRVIDVAVLALVIVPWAVRLRRWRRPRAR